MGELTLAKKIPNKTYLKKSYKFKSLNLESIFTKKTIEHLK